MFFCTFTISTDFLLRQLSHFAPHCLSHVTYELVHQTQKKFTWIVYLNVRNDIQVNKLQMCCWQNCAMCNLCIFALCGLCPWTYVPQWAVAYRCGTAIDFIVAWLGSEAVWNTKWSPDEIVKVGFSVKWWMQFICRIKVEWWSLMWAINFSQILYTHPYLDSQI